MSQSLSVCYTIEHLHVTLHRGAHDQPSGAGVQADGDLA